MHARDMGVSWWSWRDRVAVLVGLVLPLGVCAALAPFRSSLPNTDAALILVVAVVAVAAYGHRIAGALASASAALGFDFFLTAPYQRLSITDHVDVETFALLLVVGGAVTELAVRGRRSRLVARTDEKYLEAIQSISSLAESRAGEQVLTKHVCALLSELLELRGCRFESSRFGGLPRLEPDGRVRLADQYWDVDQHGLPDHEIEMLASIQGRVHGRFVLEPTAGLIPALAARKCAVIIVGQASAVLAGYRSPSRAH